MNDQPEHEVISAPERAKRSTLLSSTRVRLGAVVALAVIVGVIVWAIVGTGGSSSPTGPVAQAIAPVALSAKGLRTLARVVPPRKRDVPARGTATRAG